MNIFKYIHITLGAHKTLIVVRHLNYAYESRLIYTEFLPLSNMIATGQQAQKLLRMDCNT